MPREIATLFDRGYSPARFRSRIGERIYPKAVGRDGITVESSIFCNFDALAQRLPQPYNRHRNPDLYRLPVIPRCGRVIRQGHHVWGIDDASILLSQRAGGGGAAARGTARERACLPAGSDDREYARGDGA